MSLVALARIVVYPCLVLSAFGTDKHAITLQFRWLHLGLFFSSYIVPRTAQGRSKHEKNHTGPVRRTDPIANVWYYSHGILIGRTVLYSYSYLSHASPLHHFVYSSE
ncbi:hypothetical protein BV22DRAFT_505025 [Leucogyrophana mollusca]|uniref:Uncharacterized protein n=1 Tax=Leucogyrophana mollusca TaxID=85980 RepID=A0ACB8BG43_9AGAM|nr:hypothetical protein BV22DRAFT_505025 [Leucogyrophana mollusca]